MPSPGPGRPAGYKKRSEQATEKLTLQITPTAKRWVSLMPRGHVADLLEQEAKKYFKKLDEIK